MSLVKFELVRGFKRILELQRQIQSGSSKDLAEANDRVVELYRRAVRAVPFLMDMYNLEGILTPDELRLKIMKEFRKKTDITNPKVIDLLVVKGMEEFMLFLTQTKQRHHAIAQFAQYEDAVEPSKLGVIDRGESDFLKKFIQGNN